MQRPRNRQGRPPQQGGGARGGRRGGYQTAARSPPTHGVPNIQQVCAGAFVSIVLKVDQPTGREVQGVVADVLTSGNHPRGIKVRLVDGRVGRVQQMVTEEAARAGAAGLSNLGRNGEELNARVMQSSTYPVASRSGGSARVEKETDEPSSTYSLDAFLPPGHPLRDGSTNASPSPSAGGTAIHSCPVCGDFEGDEIAVSHHVATHFD